mgnify:CR=1 FL=1
MKKIISGLACLVLAGNIAMAENVGDKMPNFWGRQLNGGLGTYASGVMVSVAPYVDKDGEFVKDKDENYVYEYAFAVSTTKGCGIMTPFAVFSYKDKELYEDTNGDGEIDRVTKFEKIEEGIEWVQSVKPYCGLLEEQRKTDRKKEA